MTSSNPTPEPQQPPRQQPEPERGTDPVIRRRSGFTQEDVQRGTLIPKQPGQSDNGQSGAAGA